MFDFLRNLTKSAEEKQQEAMTAYLDNALSPEARRQFEQQLAQNPALRADLEQQRIVRQLLSQLPPRQTPRNFTLDPALYGRPAKQPLVQYYPALRTATMLTAVLFFFAIGLGVFTSFGPASPMTVEVTRVVANTVTENVQVEGEPVEVTRVVVETVVETVIVEVTAAPEGEAAPAAGVAEVPPMEEEASEAAAEEPEATLAPSDPAEPAESAPLPLPSITPAPTVTQSTLPRPSATEESVRAVPTAEASIFAEQAPADSQAEGDTAVANAPTTPAITTEREDEALRPLPDPLLLVQMGLLLLLLILATITLYARWRYR